MKNFKMPEKPLSRNQMKNITGSAGIITGCSNSCCPRDGRPRCPKIYCLDVVCPQYI